MSNIFNRLPFEINCVIFSLLDQHSCLESIKVCHTWFEQVPRHSTSLWKQVDFYYIWTKSNPCLLKCLGSHVREIIVSYHSLDILMTQLKLQCQCYNISSIIVHPGNDNDCVVEEDFIAGLKKAREKLTRLTLCELSHNISLLTIAYTCPNLTYLSISLDKFYNKRQKWRQQQQSFNTTTHPTTISLPSNSKTPNIIQQQQSPLLLNLKHLQLDTQFDFNSTIIPLLYHCPNIRWIEFSPFMDLEIHMLSTPANYNDFNFCRVLELCPCIEFLECNLMNYPESNNIHIDELDNDSDDNRMFSYSSIMNGTRSSTLHDDTVISRRDSNTSSSSSSNNETSSKRRNDMTDKNKNEKEGEKMMIQLREFKFANDQEDRSNRVIELLEKASNTLESLSLKQPIAGYERGLGWMNLQHIKFKRLENLIIGGSIIKKDILVSFLQNHIHTLFHLGLTAPFVSEPSIVQVVSRMECLKRFMVDIEGFNLFPRIFPRSHRRRRRMRLHQWYNEGQQQQQNQYNYNSSYNNHDYYPLHTIASRTRHSSFSTPSSTAITSTARRQLHRTRSFIQPKTPSLSKNIYLLANIATLQEIDMTGVRLSDELLYIFSTIHSLRTLSLVDAGMDPNAVTADGLLTLASGFKNNNNLQKQQLSSSSSTTCFSLENITLGYFVSLNDTVMKALGEIKSLRSLCITSCQGVTDCGLEQFIDQATSTNINGNNNFLSLSIYQCKNVTKKGLQYAYDKLGRANVKYWQYM